MFKPIVSVILPTYNRSSFIKETIVSILNQDYQYFELIIIDDGSTDDTYSVVKEFLSDKVRYFKIPNSGGPARPRNYGIEVANGELIALCDDDDLWTANKLSFCIKEFDEDTVLLYHDMYTSGGGVFNFLKGNILKSLDLGKDPYNNLLIHGNTIINSSVIFRKSILSKVEKIDENSELVSMEDYDFWLRISSTFSGFKYIKKPLGTYFISSNSLSHNPNRLLRNLQYLSRKHRGIENTDWYLYYLCKLNYQLKDFRKSYLISKHLLKRDISLEKKIKVLFVILKSKLRKNKN